MILEYPVSVCTVSQVNSKSNKMSLYEPGHSLQCTVLYQAVHLETLREHTAYSVKFRLQHTSLNWPIYSSCIFHSVKSTFYFFVVLPLDL